MKKLIIAASLALGFAGVAHAAACATDPAGPVDIPTYSSSTEQCVCQGNTGKAAVYGGPGAPVTTAAFTKTGFSVQCSANVMASFTETDGQGIGVASGSRKGNQTFIGSSNGGAVTTSVKCGGTYCTAAEVTTASGVAKTAASSG